MMANIMKVLYPVYMALLTVNGVLKTATKVLDVVIKQADVVAVMLRDSMTKK